VILFNAGSCHAGVVKRTDKERRTVHIYYGHASQAPLSNHTVFPRRLLEAEDGAARRFYGRPNLISRLIWENAPSPQERKRNLQLDLIHRLGQQGAGRVPLADLFDMAAVSIRERLGYYNVSLFMLEEGTKELVLLAHAGAYRHRVAKGMRQSVEQGMLGWVIRNGRLRLANDVRLDPHYVTIEGLATLSEICLPILVDGRTQGVLNVESDRTDAFDQGDILALEALAQQIADFIQMHRLKAEVESGGRLLGRSAAMRRVFALVEAVARSDMSVVISGETGTGKELVARTIHEKSRRCEKPFIALNCAALPENLFESELFGHERGAFTGADRRQTGKMELAQGGTLFLDEIGEVPYPLQAKLLRAVEEQRFMRVGGEKEVEVDVRILSATNQPLEQLEREGRFRRDLYFRLNAVEIRLPPLREHPEDIPLLAAHFLKEACAKLDKRIEAMAPEALQALSRHSWPGNVRELENVVARAVLLEQSTCLSQVDLPSTGPEPGKQLLMERAEGLDLRGVRRAALAEVEREYLRNLLTRTRGNLSQAARLARINRRTLYNKLAVYGLKREDFIPSD
jgi:DNA-binding NtrC family response regulator